MATGAFGSQNGSASAVVDAGEPTAARGAIVAARLAIGLAQGGALALLWNQSRSAWALNGGDLYAVLWMLAAYVPLIPLAGVGHMRALTLAVWTLAAAVLLALLTVHDITRMIPPTGRLYAAPAADEALIVFGAALLYILHHLIEPADAARRWFASYTAYVECAWRHAFQLPLSLGFAAIVFGLLALGAAMFGAIGLGTVARVLHSPWLVLPVVGLAFAFAVEQTDVLPALLQGVRNIGLALLGWLLPVAALLVALFLLALPGTGVERLWATRDATYLLLSAAVALIVFLNAAYQDGAAAPPEWLRWSGRLAGLLLLPLVGLASWALALRVDQYGLSPSRVGGLACCLAAAVYAFGYAFAALSRGAWMAQIERVNVFASVTGALIILLVLSPIADPARLAVASQVARLESGRVTPARFDFTALRFRMMRYGQDALARLATSARPEIAGPAGEAERMGFYGARPATPAGPALAHAVVRPPGAILPPEFRETHWNSAALSFTAGACLVSAQPCVLYVMDLNGDGVPDVVAMSESTSLRPVLLMRDRAGAWQVAGTFDGIRGAPEIAAVAAGQVAPIPPLAADLRVGTRRLYFVPFPNFADAMGPSPK